MLVPQPFFLRLKTNMRPAPSKTVIFTLAASIMFFPVVAAEQSSVLASSEVQTPKIIVVSVQAAALLRPILDEVQQGAEHDKRRLSNLLYRLTQRRGRAADEALVVLMCFYVGESQEEVDAVISRGKKMLPLLDKYQRRNPEVPGRTYPDSMLKGVSSKDDAFEGAVRAIHKGWHSTADNPEG
jgi:hypothetical protein